MVSFLRKFRLTRKLVTLLGKNRTKDVVSRIEKYLEEGDAILDIGAGTGFISKTLLDRKHNVTSLDIANKSFVLEVEPIIYDGEKMLFEENAFDKGLLITILHHTPDPVSVLKEAVRVSRNLVIIEDIYKSTFQKYMTYVLDSLFNLEFLHHPHTNKTDEEWQKLFREVGLELVEVKYNDSNLFLSHGTYFLHKTRDI